MSEIILPGRPGWPGRSKYQRGILQLGRARALAGVPAGASGLVTTINSAVQVVFSSVHAGEITATGFDAGPDYWGYAGSFGSIANDTYDDGGANSRTVASCYWTDVTTLSLAMDVTSVPDTDTTFTEIAIDGVVFTRASRSAYLASNDGGTVWTWNSVTPNPFLGSNPDDFEVRI